MMSTSSGNVLNGVAGEHNFNAAPEELHQCFTDKRDLNPSQDKRCSLLPSPCNGNPELDIEIA